MRTPLLALLLVLLDSPALAEDRTGDDGTVTFIDLLTIGPGDHLWTRFGHSALMVFSQRPGSKQYRSLVYNWGDADFEDPFFKWEFFRGTVDFRISTSGTLNETVTLYARSNRAVIHQRLRLTPLQVRQVKFALKRAMRPENRYYRYHHLTAGCATKIRDLLDRVLGRRISGRLEGQTDPLSPRVYGREVFAGHLGAEVLNDLFMGRLHDRAWSRYEAMCIPGLLSLYLGRIRVPDPAGSGRMVSLLGPSSVLFQRRGPPPTLGQGRTLIHLSYFWIAVSLLWGLWALRGQPHQPRRAGGWLLFWSVPMGLAALCMVLGVLVSTVIEGRINELMLTFPITDLALIGVGWRWVRGRAVAGRLLRGYAVVRLALVVSALGLHALGILVQEPRSLLVLGLVCAALLVLITRRMASLPLSDPAAGESR